MSQTESKENLATKLIAGLRAKLNKSNLPSSADNSSIYPTPQEVAHIFEKVQNQWNNPQAEIETLYQFIDEWVDAHPHQD